MEKDNPVLYIKVNKKIEKNKDLIITYKEMTMMGYDVTRTVLENAKTILLIDKNETKNGSIINKEVSYLSDIEMWYSFNLSLVQQTIYTAFNND